MPDYVKLLEIKHIDVNGELKKFLPGDWVTVGRQTAERWIAQKEAWKPTEEVSAPYNAGVWVQGFAIPGCKILDALPFVEDRSERVPPYPLTMIWKPELGFRPELVAPGFGFLQNWQIALPLYSYSILARDIGSEEDRQRTVDVTRNLDIPFYDDRVMFVRRGETINKLVGNWLGGVGDSRLALIRAIYVHKPLIYALPASWGGGT